MAAVLVAASLILGLAGCRRAPVEVHNTPAQPTLAGPVDQVGATALAPVSPLPALPVVALPLVAAPTGVHLEIADAPAQVTSTVRFLVFGDSGIGTESQFAVAARMGDVCRERGCDFGVHTGDIMYPKGIQTPDDPWLRVAFEKPYAPLHLPIYLSLGNHDHYGNADAAVAYTAKSPSRAWVLPARYYTFRAGGVRFVALDTSVPDDAQAQWAVGVMERSRKAGERFVIAFGHHPRQSYGAHGMPEATLGAWLDSVLCWRADVYLSGHDHDLQVIKDRCGVRQIVSGAAAQLRPAGKAVGGDFSSSELGFVWAEVDPAGLHADVLGTTGAGTAGGKVATRAHVDIPLRGPSTCRADGMCDGTCAIDPDCRPEACKADGQCDAMCMDDPDCAGLGKCSCDRQPVACDVRESKSRLGCGCDPACQRGQPPCTVDGVCDPGCTAGSDGDCAL